MKALPFNEGGFLMTTRRGFLVSAAAAIICAPLVVRAASLMSVRGIIIPAGELQFGFCDRLCVRVHLLRITELKNEGFSLQQIASELNRRGAGPWIYGRSDWDLQFITSILKRDEQIKRADAYVRL
jgi:hypothetical protein